MNRISYIIVLLGVFSFINCQPKEKDRFNWNAAMSAPKFYVAGGPYVEFFYQGKSIAGASSGTGIQPGWGQISGGYTGGEPFKPVPDSIYIRWRCAFDLIEYEKGAKLPREKMLELFRNPLKEEDGTIQQYALIVGGMAPGGNVTVWMGAGPENKEIIKFKADSIKSYDRYDPNSITLWTSTGEEAKEILRYGKLHGIPYEVWGKGEPKYDWDTGFTTEESNNYEYFITYYTKDGSSYSANWFMTTEKTQWKKPYGKPNNNEKKKAKLPVQLHIKWISRDQQHWYRAEVALPSDFEKRFTTPYMDPVTGKLQNYNRIIVGMDREETDKPYTFGRIWLDGPGKQEEIMKFRAAKLDVKTREYSVSLYSIPKGFVFPKWEGREPLTTPDVEFWQEK